VNAGRAGSVSQMARPPSLTAKPASSFHGVPRRSCRADHARRGHPACGADVEQLRRFPSPTSGRSSTTGAESFRKTRRVRGSPRSSIGTRRTRVVESSTVTSCAT
jgi:hypothetical protein